MVLGSFPLLWQWCRDVACLCVPLDTSGLHHSPASASFVMLHHGLLPPTLFRETFRGWLCTEAYGKRVWAPSEWPLPRGLLLNKLPFFFFLTIVFRALFLVFFFCVQVFCFLLSSSCCHTLAPWPVSDSRSPFSSQGQVRTLGSASAASPSFWLPRAFLGCLGFL